MKKNKEMYAAVFMLIVHILNSGIIFYCGYPIGTVLYNMFVVPYTLMLFLHID